MSDSGLFIVLIAMIGGAIRVSTPFMFVALGETLTEKSGRINLGLEATSCWARWSPMRARTRPAARGSAC
jgi:ABC-type uncharacterized transport system permease subunit